MPFDERRTFLTEFSNVAEDNENKDDEEPRATLPPIIAAQQMNSTNDSTKSNYVLKVLEIRKVPSASSKRDR